MEVLENDKFILKEKSLCIATLPPFPPVLFIKFGIKFFKNNCVELYLLEIENGYIL